MPKDRDKQSKKPTDYHKKLLQLGEDLTELRRFHSKQMKKIDSKMSTYEKKLKKIDDRMPSP